MGQPLLGVGNARSQDTGSSGAGYEVALQEKRKTLRGHE